MTISKFAASTPLRLSVPVCVLCWLLAVCLSVCLTVRRAVDGDGLYTADVGIAALVGRPVQTDGNKYVTDTLRARGVLLEQHTLTHRYPYDWRTKKPVIIRYRCVLVCSCGVCFRCGMHLADMCAHGVTERQTNGFVR